MFLKKGYFHVVQAKTGLFLSTNGTTEVSYYKYIQDIYDSNENCM